MEILALYTSPESLGTALSAGARHLAATLDGFALVYMQDSSVTEPDGWAGFSCAQDAQTAGQTLETFRKQVDLTDRPIRMDPPTDPPRIWSRAAGGIFGFPLRQGNTFRGCVIVGCPGPWPRMRNAETESVMRQLTLVLDHHAVSQNPADSSEPSDELLRLSEQIFAQDIELIRQEEKISQVEQFKSDLVEKLSRDFRTPLGGIIERIITVMTNDNENLSDPSKLALKDAMADGNALLRTLQNLLDLWKIRQGDVRIENQEVSLRDVVDEAVFNVSESLKPDVEVEKQVASNTPKVRTDLAKLNQIIFHLLDNAVKFTHQGRIVIDVSVEEGQLLGTVTDTGIGVSMEDQSQIFDEFFQVDPAHESRYHGSGLGLALARALVEHMGGAMSVSSQVGRGSRFSFTLPVQIV